MLESSSSTFSSIDPNACPVQNLPKAPSFSDENKKSLNADYYARGYTLFVGYALETDPRFVSSIPFAAGLRNRSYNQRIGEQYVRNYTDKLTKTAEEQLTTFYTKFSYAYFTNLSYLKMNWSSLLSKREAPFLQTALIVDGRTMYKQIVVDVARRGVRVSAPRAASGGFGYRIAMRELNNTISSTAGTVQKEVMGGSDTAVSTITQIGLKDDAVRFKFLDYTNASNTLLNNIFKDTTEGLKVAIVSPTGRIIKKWLVPKGQDITTLAATSGSIMSELTYNPGNATQDKDRDTVVDVSDHCVDTSSGATVQTELGQKRGCSSDQTPDCLSSDSDNDGVPDREDFCPNSENITGIQRQLGSKENGCGEDPATPITPKDVVATSTDTESTTDKETSTVDNQDSLCLCGLWNTVYGKSCGIVRPKAKQNSGKFWVQSGTTRFCSDQNKCLIYYRSYLQSRAYCPNGWRFVE